MNRSLKEPIKVALLGYGYAGKTFHAPLISAVAGLTLTTVISSDRSKVEADLPRVTVSNRSEDAFEDTGIDLVIIATPNSTHFDLAKQALTHGKHVVVDKPLTTSTAQARELTTLAEGRSRLLSVFHNRRWDSDFLTLKGILNSEQLGDVMYLESRLDRYRPQVRQRWREQSVPGGGLWWDLGPHLIDQALELFGPPESIYADFAQQRQGSTAVDYFHALLKYGTKRVVLHASSLAAADMPRFIVHGTTGSFIKHGIDVQETALKSGMSPGCPGWGHDAQNGTLVTWTNQTRQARGHPSIPGNYLTYYHAVADAIQGHTPNPVPPADALAVMTLLELGYQSAKSGRELVQTDSCSQTL